MLLSVYDMGLHEITIYGPEGLAQLISSLQLFIYRYYYDKQIRISTDYHITVIEIGEDIQCIDLKNGCNIYPYCFSSCQSSHSL